MADGGAVWPNIRAEEAQRDGLDAIAMTDHLEYQPHREEHVSPLLAASIVVESVSYIGHTSVLSVVIENTSDASFVVENEGRYALHRNSKLVTLAPHTKTTLDVKTLRRLDSIELPLDVLNVVTAPGEHATITLPVVVDQD